METDRIGWIPVSTNGFPLMETDGSTFHKAISRFVAGELSAFAATGIPLDLMSKGPMPRHEVNVMGHGAMIASAVFLVTAAVILAPVLPTLVVFLLTASYPSTPVKSGSPVNPIVDRGTWINISAAG